MSPLIAKPHTWLRSVQIVFLAICTLLCCLPIIPVSASPVEPQTAVTDPSESDPSEDDVTSSAPAPDDDELTEEEKLSVQALQQQRNELQAQAKNLQEIKKTYTDSLIGLLQQKENIEAQIRLKQREIDINAKLLVSITDQIHVTDEALMAQEQHILVLRHRIMGKFQALRQRMQLISKGGEFTSLQMLLSSDSYRSFLINSRMAKRINDMERVTLSGLESELSVIEEQRDLLKLQQQQYELQRQTYQDAESSLDTTKQELIALVGEADVIAEQLNHNIMYYQQQYVQIRDQQSNLQSQIQSITNDIDPGDMLAADLMFWPAPDCSVITSSYKARWGRWHYGMDIASWGDSSGKSIVAAADGVVIFAGGEPSTGYGYYVMVDHGYDTVGRRIVTLYGHCSELFVNVGDTVFGGSSVLAAIGNTGNSTGPHLHFEVRVDGSAVDPVANGYIVTDGISVLG